VVQKLLFFKIHSWKIIIIWVLNCNLHNTSLSFCCVWTLIADTFPISFIPVSVASIMQLSTLLHTILTAFVKFKLSVNVGIKVANASLDDTEESGVSNNASNGETDP